MMVNQDFEDTGIVTTVSYEEQDIITKNKKPYNRTMTHNFVPRYMRVSKKKNIYLTGLAEADYVFVTVRNRSTDETGEASWTWRGMVMHGYILKLGRASYMYMSTKDIITGSPYVKSTIASYAVVGMTDYYYNDPTNIKNLELHFGTSNSHNSPSKRDIEHLISLPTSKITGEHHTHYNVAEMLLAFKGQHHDKVTTAISKMTNATQAFASGTLGWYWSLPVDLKAIVREADMWNETTVEDWAKKAKYASRFCKAMQNCIEADLRPLFEIDVLSNRGIGEINWVAEKEHRVKPDTVNVTYEEVYKEASIVFNRAQIEGRSPPRMSWETYWNNRWQYTPTGSIHSQCDEDAQYIFKERNIKNKFMTLIRMPNSTTLSYFTGRNPETHAWSSDKWEWGKKRAIYGVDLTTFVLTNFGMHMCEEVLPGDFPVGSKSNDDYVSAAVNEVLRDNSPYAFDFADFNAQHKTGAMKAVIHAFRDVFAGKLTDEQIEAINWVHAAHNTVWIHDNMGLKETYKSNGTLLSGHRLTTFINSTLNKVYSKKLIEGSHRYVKSVHNGDDILFGIRSISECSLMRRNAFKYNIRAQQAKCAAFGIAEFLRVDHTRKGNGQYLTRGMATLVHSRIESSGGKNISDSLEANEMRLLEATDRGLTKSAAEMLRYLYNKRVSAIFEHTTEDAYVIVNTHRALGGLSSGNKALLEHDIENVLLEQGDIEELEGVSLPGIAAFANATASRLDLPEKREQITKAITQATLTMALPRRTGKAITKITNRGESLIKVGLYKCFKDLRAKATFGQAKMAGVVLALNSDDDRIELLKMTISKVEDPIKWLSLLV
uniref:RdRp n=1 Tax=viral metagenome TaxID=1070528 RepID=A0A2V0RCB6_9ZZZZ